MNNLTPKFKKGDIVTCSFPYREKESKIAKTVISVFPERDKYGAVVDYLISTDGGMNGKPINLVQEKFFTASQSKQQ